MNSVELLNKIQNLRDTIKDLEDTVGHLKGVLETQLRKEGVEHLDGFSATAFWQSQTKVEVKDWNAVMEFVFKNKAFDILQKRITPKALKARFDAGASIKGVTITEGAKAFVVKGKKDESEEA